MLLPFSELKLHVHGFDGKFVPSFVNDIANDGGFKNGLLAFEAGSRTGYVLISGGHPVLSRVVAFSGDSQISTNIPMESFLDESQLDLYLLSVDDDKIFKCLSDFLVYPLSIYAPYRFVNVPLLVSSFAETKESALLCLKHGDALDIAVFDEGNFSFIALFDKENEKYAFEYDPMKFGSYLGELDILKPTVFCINVSDKVFASSFFSSSLDFLAKDPVSVEAEFYFGVFDMIFKFFSGKVPKKKMPELAGKLFAYLRGRYPEIYSSLEYSKDTGQVNWNVLLESRKYIAEEYRFGGFHNYLDEILRLLVKTAKSLSERGKIDGLLFDIRALAQSAETEKTILAGMFDRFDKLLKI